MIRLAVMSVCALLVLGLSRAWAETRALVVGVDEYYYIQPLKGAVNDARDIHAALEKLDVRDRTLLLNGKATKAAIRKAWFAMVERANPGDLLIFTYAGHGGQEPENVKGTEKDGKDENFILAGFNGKSRSGRKERIVDNEIHVWLKAASDRKLKVVFVADSCHSGTMTRALDRRFSLPSRDTPPYAIPDDLPVPEESRKGARISQDQLPGVLFLAATQEHRKTPEVLINGRPRGALSYVFARILEGAADNNHDRVTTLFELEDYLRAMVRTYSQARQTPEVIPHGEDRPVLRVNAAAPAAIMDDDEAAPLKVAVMGMPLEAAARILERIPGAELAGPGVENPALVWDAKEKVIANGTGDIVARDVFEHQLPGVVAKWRALASLQEMAGRSPLEMRMLPDDSVHKQGEVVTFKSAPLKFPYVTVFNLAWNGQVQYLYPLRNDPDGHFTGRPWKISLKVTPPYGSDHLVLIASEKLPAALRARLRDIRDPARLAPLLRKTLKDNPHQSGIQPLFTAPGDGR